MAKKIVTGVDNSSEEFDNPEDAVTPAQKWLVLASAVAGMDVDSVTDVDVDDTGTAWLTDNRGNKRPVGIVGSKDNIVK